MPRDARALIERLPSLYRPEPDDGTLLSTFLNAVAAELNRARDEASMVLPAHWSQHADRAALDSWFARRRTLAGLPALAPTDLVDFANAKAMLVAIKDAKTPLTQHLKTGLPAALRTDLNAWDDVRQPPPIPLQRRMLDALNRRVRSEPLYDAKRFVNIAISDATRIQAEDQPVGAERVAVNVQLLLEAFPALLRRAQLDLPWVRDLGRLAAVVPIVPWREPAALRETVEAFRVRIGRMVAIAREGLGTVDALRSVVEATLPVDMTQPPELRDAPFEIEEFAPPIVQVKQAPTTGEPHDLVGPLMRWDLVNDGLGAVAPTVFITGLQAGPGISETADPMVELYGVGAARPRIGLGFAGKLDPNETLRLRPAYNTWMINGGGLQRAEHLPTATSPADPSTPGSFFTDNDALNGVVAIARTDDGVIWVASEGGTQLDRFDGRVWQEVATGLSAIRCFATTPDTLLIGTANGLLRSALYPTNNSFTPVAVPGFAEQAIRTISAARDGIRFIGTDSGALRWNGNGPPETVTLGGDAGVSTAIHAIHHDATGATHFAGALGVFAHQAASDSWFWYAGEAFTEQKPEWRAFGAGANDTPAAPRVFLPEVLAVHRGPDTSLWFGTAAGIARYVARSESDTTFTTLLEAFPDLTTGAVTQIHQDGRGGIWFCTDRGLLRYDGRDFWQLEDEAWQHLGRADVLPGTIAQSRGAWRFHRASGQWQRYDTRSSSFVATAVQPRTAEERPITAVLTCDSVVGDLGVVEENEFEAVGAVASSDLYVHIQPTEERIVNGGMPFVPRLPVGKSTWRYLSREPVNLVPAPPRHRPAWSMEGRLFPPPPPLDAPYSGRWGDTGSFESNLDEAVFAYDPAAKVQFSFGPSEARRVLVRLRKRPGQANIDPAVLNRVWEGIQLVRPAGVRATLAVDDTIVRGS